MAKITRPSGPRQAIRSKIVPVNAHRRRPPRKKTFQQLLADARRAQRRLFNFPPNPN